MITKIGGRSLGDLLYCFISGFSPAASEDTLRHYDLTRWLFIPNFLSVGIGSKMGTPGCGGMSGVPLSENPMSRFSPGKPARDEFDHSAQKQTELVLALVSRMGLGSGSNMPTKDVWTKELIGIALDMVLQERKPEPLAPTWTAFASAVCADIRKLLGPSIGRAYQELRNATQDARREMQRALQWTSKWQDPGSPRKNDKALRDMVTMLDSWVLRDDNRDADGESDEEEFASIVDKYRSEPHALLRSHPLWCCIMLAQLRLSVWSAGEFKSVIVPCRAEV